MIRFSIILIFEVEGWDTFGGIFWEGGGLHTGGGGLWGGLGGGLGLEELVRLGGLGGGVGNRGGMTIWFGASTFSPVLISFIRCWVLCKNTSTVKGSCKNRVQRIFNCWLNLKVGYIYIYIYRMTIFVTMQKKIQIL